MEKISQKRALYAGAAAAGVLVCVAAFISPAGAWPLAAIALGCVAAANLDQFSELSAGSSGLRVLLRETKDELTNIKDVVEVMSEFQLTLMQQMGRFAHNDDVEKAASLDRMMELMRKAGVAETKIAEIKKTAWDRWVLFDYVLAITGGSYVPNSKDTDIHQRWRALRSFHNVPTVSELTRFLDEIADSDLLRRSLLASYEHYRETGKHKDPVLWSRRDEVPQLLGKMRLAPLSKPEPGN